ncbi:DUF6668 family protein [Planosporangium sp. 12N6]|uniref:DUF6668 family protein n=1 Tax=Planosporangium spinosum TaxID=3402278 RepID=UPI003CF70686
MVAGGWPPVWWVGCHGGAGTSTLARVCDVGVDVGMAWPLLEQGWPTADVVLVCRASARGLWSAVGALEQYKRRQAPVGVRLVGLVAVAATPRRPPRIVTERLQLTAGWTPALWRVGWVEEYLAADDPRDLGVPPDVAALRHALGQALNI